VEAVWIGGGMMRNDAATGREGLGLSTDGFTSCGTASPLRMVFDHPITR
jgi:hypothetical protein